MILSLIHICDGGDLAPGQLGGQLHGIGDGGAEQDEARVAAIKRAQAHQATKHVGQMASEYAAVGMQLVDDDGVVFRAAAHDLHDALDFRAAADHGVEFLSLIHI